MMRIISGVRRGKKLLSLPGDHTRPTLERVKQAFFNAIQFEIQGKTVLDLFAGSGQLGLEALSRGAAFCYFNDADGQACDVIQKNISACGFEEICKLTCKQHIECVRILKEQEKRVSLVFLDPPYGKGLINDALCAMRTASVLQPGAVIVCESAETDEIDCTGFTVRRTYRYGGIKITILDNGE